VAERNIACPRCRTDVAVPTSGEKVRCPECGQKLRFNAPADEPPPLPSPKLSVPPPLDLPEPAAQTAQPDAPPPKDAGPRVAPEAAADAEELHELWPALAALVGRVYEHGQVTSGDRLIFESDAERAADLARRLFPAPDPEFPRGHEVMTSVLPQTSLDDVIGLRLEQFRQLQQGLDEAQALIDHRLPQAQTSAPSADTAVEAAPAKRRSAGFPVISLLAAGLVLALAAVVAVPALRQRVFGHPLVAKLLGRDRESRSPDEEFLAAAKADIQDAEEAGPEAPAETKRPAPRDTAGPARPTPKEPEQQPVPAPRPEPEPTPRIEPTREPAPKPKAKAPAPKNTAPPPKKKAPAKRYYSRWKPREDGWIELFDGTKLRGWTGADKQWTLTKGVLVGNAPGAIEGLPQGQPAFINAVEADWTDYALAIELRLDDHSAIVLSHGVLAAHLGTERLRLGYPQQGWKTLDKTPKGLAAHKWYTAVLDVKGTHAELRINDQAALQTDDHESLAGGPAIEALHGRVAIRAIRAKIHPTDPDYRAVALGGGYTEDPSQRPVISQAKDDVPRELPEGVHTLFEGRDTEGWDFSGAWTVRDGSLVGRAGDDEIATAVYGATAENRDYVIRVECRLLRRSDQARPGEYFFIIFRHRSPESFYAMRIPTEGIFELGYYRNGRFRQTTRGVRKGHYNEWHEIELTVRGNQVSMRIDRIGGLPDWPIRYIRRGAIGVGVTGGQAAFRDFRVRILP
jgi:hypothetical protein